MESYLGLVELVFQGFGYVLKINGKGIMEIKIEETISYRVRKLGAGEGITEEIGPCVGLKHKISAEKES